MSEPLAQLAEDINPAGIEAAEIVVGIPSFNEESTIRHVVQVIDEGLAMDFPNRSSVIVNADNASTDDTREVFLETKTKTPKIYLSTPEDVRGKGNNLFNLFAKSEQLGAKAIVTLDADLQSVESRWVKKLANPVFKGFDFVTPIYIRHKYDGTITNNIAYPLITAVFGHRLRQPIGGDYGMSGHMVEKYLAHAEVSEAVRNFGIDIWMAAQACLEDMNICQSFMDAPKIHNPKDPGNGLDRMFHNVIGTAFDCMMQAPEQWLNKKEAEPSVMFGFGFGARHQPERIWVSTGNLHRQFNKGFYTYRDDFEEICGNGNWESLLELAESDPFDMRVPQPLWARLVYDLAVAYAAEMKPRKEILAMLLGLYKGKVLSDILTLTERGTWVAERHWEQGVDYFEDEKPYLVRRWKEKVGS
jgi:glycosyltransferase involved in cell wall biosynthesis